MENSDSMHQKILTELSCNMVNFVKNYPLEKNWTFLAQQYLKQNEQELTICQHNHNS